MRSSLGVLAAIGITSVASAYIHRPSFEEIRYHEYCQEVNSHIRSLEFSFDADMNGKLDSKERARLVKKLTGAKINERVHVSIGGKDFQEWRCNPVPSIIVQLKSERSKTSLRQYITFAALDGIVDD